MNNKNILFFDAINAININNGVVKLILGNQPSNQILENQGKAINPEPSQVVAMPLNSFMYALAVFIKEPKNKEMIEKVQEAAGLNKTQQ